MLFARRTNSQFVILWLVVRSANKINKKNNKILAIRNVQIAKYYKLAVRTVRRTNNQSITSWLFARGINSTSCEWNLP